MLSFKKFFFFGLFSSICLYFSWNIGGDFFQQLLFSGDFQLIVVKKIGTLFYYWLGFVGFSLIMFGVYKNWFFRICVMLIPISYIFISFKGFYSNNFLNHNSFFLYCAGIYLGVFAIAYFFHMLFNIGKPKINEPKIVPLKQTWKEKQEEEKMSKEKMEKHLINIGTKVGVKAVNYGAKKIDEVSDSGSLLDDLF